MNSVLYRRGGGGGGGTLAGIAMVFTIVYLGREVTAK